MNWRRICRWCRSLLCILLFIVATVTWFVGSQLVAPANRRVGPPPSDLPVQSLTIPSNSGSQLAAWYIPAPEATATVILVHPIRSDRRAMLSRAKLLFENGFSSLLVDLQAHGESPGENITAGYLERHDVSAAVDFVRNLHPNHKIGIVGWSRGGAAALLASPRRIDALVLEAVYPTITEAVHDRVAIRLGPLHYLLAPVLLVQLQPRLGIAPQQLRPIDHIAHVQTSVLLTAGEIDNHTPLSETNRLYAAAVEPKQLVVFEDAAHSDFLAHDPEKYESFVIEFFDHYLQK